MIGGGEMTMYEQCYRRAEVLDRWADIYGDGRTIEDFVRFDAARLRLWAEVIKAARLDEAAAWIDGRLSQILTAVDMFRYGRRH